MVKSSLCQDGIRTQVGKAVLTEDNSDCGVQVKTVMDGRSVLVVFLGEMSRQHQQLQPSKCSFPTGYLTSGVLLGPPQGALASGLPFSVRGWPAILHKQQFQFPTAWDSCRENWKGQPLPETIKKQMCISNGGISVQAKDISSRDLRSWVLESH